MAKDIADKETHDAFITFEQLERETFIGNALATGGHYQAVRPDKFYQVTGNRYAGSKTPDIVRDKWATDRSLIAYMEERYGPYDLDAAADQSNAVCPKFYDEKTDCLKRWWGKNKHIWLNPPYSFPDPFILKAIEQMEHDNQIDILLPGDNSTAWFRDAQKMAADFGVEVLGSLPLDIRIREQADSGRPTVVAEPDGEIAATYRAIARKVAVRIAEKAKDMSLKMPAIKVQNT